MFATTICIILFSAPLATIQTVLTTKSSDSIYAPATFAQVQGVQWTCSWLTLGLTLTIPG